MARRTRRSILPVTVPTAEPRTPEATMPPADQPLPSDGGPEVLGTWHGILANEGIETGDGREFEPDSLWWELLPLPLRWCPVDVGGHQQARHVGWIDQVDRDGNQIPGSGTYFDPEFADYITRAGQVGLSVDCDDESFVILVSPDAPPVEITPGHPEPITPPEERQVFSSARVRGVTAVDFGAFIGGVLWPGDQETAMEASWRAQWPNSKAMTQGIDTPQQTPTTPRVTGLATRTPEPRDTGTPNTTHAGLLLTAEDTGRILLLQRALEDGDTNGGLWEFPGGGIEDGETPETAALREFAEEAGAPLPDHAEPIGHQDHGIYRLHAYTIPTEADYDLDRRDVICSDCGAVATAPAPVQASAPTTLGKVGHVVGLGSPSQMMRVNADPAVAGVQGADTDLTARDHEDVPVSTLPDPIGGSQAPVAVERRRERPVHALFHGERSGESPGDPGQRLPLLADGAVGGAAALESEATGVAKSMLAAPGSITAVCSACGGVLHAANYNPDDPDGDRTEALAWWRPEQITDGAPIRPEVLENDFSELLTLVATVGAADLDTILAWLDAEDLEELELDDDEEILVADGFAPLHAPAGTSEGGQFIGPGGKGGGGAKSKDQKGKGKPRKKKKPKPKMSKAAREKALVKGILAALNDVLKTLSGPQAKALIERIKKNAHAFIGAQGKGGGGGGGKGGGGGSKGPSKPDGPSKPGSGGGTPGSPGKPSAQGVAGIIASVQGLLKQFGNQMKPAQRAKLDKAVKQLAKVHKTKAAAGTLVAGLEELDISTMPPELKAYWLGPEGAAKIGYGTPGQFKRCQAALKGKVPGIMIDGTCANLIHEATGEYPGHHQNDADIEEYQMKPTPNFADTDFAPDTGSTAPISEKTREKAAEKGEAMPDGSFPIRNCQDLADAVQAVGRAKNPEGVRAFIRKRAKELDCADYQLPDGFAAAPADAMPADAPSYPGDQPDDPAEDEQATKHLEAALEFLHGDDAAIVQEVLDNLAAMAPTPEDVMTASAGPLAPPEAWFEQQQLDGPTGLTVTPDGRIFGHLATWKSCHQGSQYTDRCVPPPSDPDPEFFHVGQTLTAEGTLIDVGRLTVGAGHADTRVGLQAALEHYDNASTTAAVVRAYEDEHGIALFGATVPEATPHQIAALRRSPLSGDWRPITGLAGKAGKRRRLIAAHAVNTGGFPVLRGGGSGLSLVASSGQEFPSATDGTPLEVLAQLRSSHPRLLAALDEGYNMVASITPQATILTGRVQSTDCDCDDPVTASLEVEEPGLVAAAALRATLRSRMPAPPQIEEPGLVAAIATRQQMSKVIEAGASKVADSHRARMAAHQAKGI